MNACDNPNYNYAYRDPQGDFRTILAYNCKTNQCDENEANSCPRIMRFSTSDFANYNYNGKPLGTAEIDNARQFNEVRTAIAMCKTHVGTSPPTQLPSTIPAIVPTIGPTSSPTISPTSSPAGSNGDPHFKTWKNEHFEYHGQCDLVLTKDESFANDIGLEVQIRTKVVRFWSYIKNAAIRIGEDILEVEGGAETEATNHYWYNLAYQEKIETLGGFPVTYHQPVAYKRRFEVDLSSKFPGQKIIVSTYKEFVRVDFENGTEEAFGNTKGLLGDFNSGDTLARDGSTVLNDFWEYGNEWQVLPFENMLFHETSEPQFPQKCIQPEDPRGDRRRKLAESTVSEAQAEAACAHLKDPLDRKDCLYDILATQDLDMVGAY